jgi:hypothetical protein
MEQIILIKRCEGMIKNNREGSDMSRKTILNLSLVLFIIGLIVGLVSLTYYFIDLPNRLSQHETIILGQNRLTPGSKAALRVVVRDSKDASPLPNADIEVALKPATGGRAETVFTGRTDQNGTTEVLFQVPDVEESQQILVVKTTSDLGSDFVEQAVTLDRDFRILLSTDKPLFQPGQIIHLRALALSTFDLTPADGEDLEILIADGKGNKVFRETLSTSAFGVAATDFRLASLVNTGPYKITATLGNTTSEKTVSVEHYVLPKFAVSVQTDQTYYLPGQKVAGFIQADYFFGKPVDEGEILLESYTFDVERAMVFSQQGTTDEKGNYAFEFTLPDYIAGTDLEGGLGRFFLQATVTDLTKHSETSNTSLPIASSELIIEAVPEGGQFRPGVENILYVFTSYPDGSPAQTDLSLEFYNGIPSIEAESGPYGLAEIRLTPTDPWQEIQITAHDVRGAATTQQFYFEGEYAEETVLLRPEQPIYQVGDTMALTILTSQVEGTVYFDIVRAGQTVSTQAVPINDHQAQVAVDLSPEMYGTLELHAYKILSWGGIVRDTRLVVVDPATDLNLLLSPGQKVYRPGDTARLDIRTIGQGGDGVQTAIGLAIVDESVYALAKEDPGFAKLYFMLEKELLEPKYDLHGFSVPELIGGISSEDENLESAVEGAASASLADTPRGSHFSLQANSHEESMQRVAERQQNYFTGLSKGLYGVVLIIPLAVLGLNAHQLWREERLGQSLLLIVGLISLLSLLFILWPIGESLWWAQSPLDRLTFFLSRLEDIGPFLILGMGAAGILAFIALMRIAAVRKDGKLGWSLALMPVFLIFAIFTVYAASQTDIVPSTSTIGWTVIAFLLLPLAFGLRFAGFAWERKNEGALAALILAGFLLLGTVPVVALGSQSMAFQRLDGGIAQPMLIDAAIEGDMFFAGVVREEAEFNELAAPPAEPETDLAKGNNQAQGPEPPRLRQFFPETMLWIPDAVTDNNGHLQLDFPVADSITTWRMTALASSQDGRLGSTTAPLRVFQDFFIDLDLPLALTVGDEVSIPVGIFNYLPEAQSVRLDLDQAEWFQLLDQASKEIKISANDISVAYFRVKVIDFGRQSFKVTAWGSEMSDAIQKEVRVYPDGKEIQFTQSDRLNPGDPVQQTIIIPPDAIPGTQTLTVKIYPGVVSQVVEGLDSILRMPFGCFEQTSSTTYPNVLVLDYLQTTGQASPEVQFKAEEYINLGYQRLTTFEVGGSGGFSLFGDPPPDRMLSAYGLQEFGDMSRVHHIDPALIDRAAEWLLGQQKGDGSWENDRGLVHESTWSNLENDRLPVTAYIIWSLIDAGFVDDARTQKGLAYIREFQSSAEDPYVLALVANALVAADLAGEDDLNPVTENVLNQLAGMAKLEGNSATWSSGVSTFMGSEGQTGSIETTALVVLAFLRADRQPELANAGLTALVQNKDSFGTWYSTQATVLSLKALIESVRTGAEDVNATVTVSLNDGQTRVVEVNDKNFDVVQSLTFDDINIGRENKVAITVEGIGNLMYQITGGYYLPWDKLTLYPEIDQSDELVTIDLAYDRTELTVNDTVSVDVTVALNQPGGRAESTLIDLGLPPGFTVKTEDLAALVARYDDVPEDYALPTIERFELTGRQILIYVNNLTNDHPLQFSYRLQAKFPLSVQTPASNAYDYYNPDVIGEAHPQLITVNP